MPAQDELRPASHASNAKEEAFHQSGKRLTVKPASRRNGAQKLLGVLITIGEAVAYVVSGMYGDVRELGAGNAILIIVQVRVEGLGDGVTAGVLRRLGRTNV